jgi:CO/xanthine dehydrogenase Mo-binding subunit
VLNSGIGLPPSAREGRLKAVPQKACHPDRADEQVGAVATDSEEVAEDALRLIDLVYEPLPFVTRNEMLYTAPGLSPVNVHRYDHVHVRLSHP